MFQDPKAKITPALAGAKNGGSAPPKKKDTSSGSSDEESDDSSDEDVSDGLSYMFNYSFYLMYLCYLIVYKTTFTCINKKVHVIVWTLIPWMRKCSVRSNI